MCSALATTSRYQWPRSRVPPGRGFIFTKGREDVHGLGRYATNIYCKDSIIPSPSSLDHFIHIAGLADTKYFWEIKYGVALRIVKIPNPLLYTYWPICLPSQSQFSRVKAYPTKDLIFNMAEKSEWKILYSVF